jgi:hypothetical protein
VSPVKYELDLYIPEDNILHSHRRENLKSYVDGDDCGAVSAMNEWQGKPKYCPSANLSTTDPT